LLNDVDLSWSKINALPIQKMISAANQKFDVEHPSSIVPDLLKIYSAIKNLDDSYWRTQKEKEVKDLIAACAGLWFETYADESGYAIGDSIKTRSQFVSRSEIPVKLMLVNRVDKDILLNNTIQTVDNKVVALKTTQPYWLADKHPVGSFSISNQYLVGDAENQSSLDVEVGFLINDTYISFQSPVLYKYTDPVQGEVYQPLAIGPPVTATLSEKAFVFAGNTAKAIQVNVRSYRDNSDGKIVPQVPPGWIVSPASIDISLAKKGDEQAIEFVITPSGTVNSGTVSVNMQAGTKTFNQGLKIVAYNHIPMQTLFPLAEARAEKIDLRVAGKRIGYITGAGDLVPQSLKQVGFDVTTLTENQLANSNLSEFDAIVTGIRAYNVNQRMKFLQAKLLKYVANGGTLLVQYNVNNGLTEPNIGPYPFKLSRNRVTEEDAKVTFLAPGHAVLNYPNRILTTDFDNWIQERGLYFVTDADPKYTSILRMKDTNEADNDGSLIVADYGKGKFVYTSLVFFRELPAGVPGAYRLFVNLIAKSQQQQSK
jgi:hypothetical protein